LSLDLVAMNALGFPLEYVVSGWAGAGTLGLAVRVAAVPAAKAERATLVKWELERPTKVIVMRISS